MKQFYVTCAYNNEKPVKMEFNTAEEASAQRNINLQIAKQMNYGVIIMVGDNEVEVTSMVDRTNTGANKL
jgi:sarcosine oxidase delta subunit